MSRLLPVEMRALFQLLFGLVVFAAIVNGFQVVVPPSSELCFFEDLTANQKMGVTFEVSHGGHLDIDFKVSLSNIDYYGY